MEIRRRKMARIVLNSLLGGTLSALVCFAQTSPASHPAGKSAAQSSSATASAQAASPEKVVLKVGETNVTKADIDYLIGSLNPQVQKAVALRGRKPVGDEYAMMLLLSQKAQSEKLDASPEFQRKLALEKLQLLAQEEYRHMAESIKVSPDEISAYYNAHKGDFEEAELREFVIRKKPADAKAGAKGLPEEEAKARLAAIQKAIEGGTDVKQVAKQFDVPNVVMVNPEPVTVHKGEMLPALDKAAFELKENQFSQPVETPQALVLLQMLKRQQPGMQAVSSQIEDSLRQQKLKTALDDIRAKANIWMDPDYFKAPEPARTSGALGGSSGAAPKAPPQQ
ncbi:MAG: peptidyl-prolyl cis-trans isomerase [Acidobacteriota bacterium]